MIQLALASLILMDVSEGPKVFVDGKLVAPPNVPAPIIRDNRVQVPMRGIFEALGAGVQYLPQTRQVVVTRGGPEVTLLLDENFAYVDGQQRYLDYPPEVVDGTVMVPLRFVSQALGAYVNWDPLRRNVTVSTSVPSDKDGE